MNIFVSALEVSSNVHLSFLISEMSKKTDVELFGVFDPNLSSNAPLYLPSDFCIMGFIDVFYRLPFIMRAMSNLSKVALSCDKILLMDSSSFNIPLAKKIKQADNSKEIIYYILPQVWAWKPWRAKIIEKYCDVLAGILPFEIDFYSKKAMFVGHPLLDEIKHVKTDVSHSNIITFMPGSRKGEIRRIFPIFRLVRDRLVDIDPMLTFNLVVPKAYINSDLADIYDNTDGFNIVYDSHDSLYKSKFAFICSGTATLECAIIGTPFVLAYKARFIDALIVRLLLNIKYIGLANILFYRMGNDVPFHRECVQDNLTVDNLLESYMCSNGKEFLLKSFKIRDYLHHGSSRVVSGILLNSK